MSGIRTVPGRVWGTLLAAPLLMSVAWACSSEPSSGDGVVCKEASYDSGLPEVPHVDPMDEATFGTLFVKTYCDALEGCCKGAGVPFGRAKCEAARAELLAKYKVSTLSHYVPEQGARCISAVKWFGLVCPQVGSVPGFAVGVLCAGVYQGTLDPGDNCSYTYQCSAPPGGSTLCAGVCHAFVTDRGPGEKCTREHDDVVEYHSCIDGYECDEGSGTCKKECEGGLGASCAAQPCASGLRCDASEHCVPVKPLGSACVDALDCLATCVNGQCALGLDSGTCYTP